MRKIRIGKDIRIKWAILTNGVPESLDGRRLKLQLTTPLMQKIELTFTTDRNTIEASVYGIAQKTLGRYSLTLWENYGNIGQTAVDSCNAFELVPTTCMEGGQDSSLDTEHLELAGEMTVGVKGASAYEIAVANGYIGSEEEWLKSLKQPAEDAAIAAEAQIQSMISLENTVSQAEEQRIQDEQSRSTAEASRQTAEQQRGEEFNQMESEFESIQREAALAIQDVNTAAASAVQAAEQATSSALSADAAARNAAKAADTANAAGQSIAALEQTISLSEQSRLSAEKSRTSAETARQQAEESRVQEEEARISQEQSRQESEQQRAEEFSALVQESRNATENASQAAVLAKTAAENANNAANTVSGRLSEVYTDYTAIEASGETDPNKIYIDGETLITYVYKNGKYERTSGKPQGGYNRALYEAANGVVFNEETGFYELNGLTDITEEEMAAIYTHSNNVWELKTFEHKFYNIKKIRTLIPITDTKINLSTVGMLNGSNWNVAFHSCSDLEVLYWLNLKAKPSTATQCFCNCYKLRKVDYMDFSSLTGLFSVNIMFKGCKMLEEIWIYKVVYSLSFIDSPRLKYECFKYMIDNAANGSEITITVHPTTYSYLTGAVEPTEQVGGTAEEWQALLTSALDKQITFVSA